MRSLPMVAAVSPPSAVMPPMYSKNEFTPRPTPSKAPTPARSTTSAAASASFSARDMLQFLQNRLRGLDAADGNPALRRQIEMHLVHMFQTFVDIAQMRARFPLEAGEIPAHRCQVLVLEPLVGRT